MPPRKGETPAAWAEETSSRGKSSSRLRRGDAQGARAEEGTLGDQGHDAAGEVDRHGVAADGAGRLGEGGLGLPLDELAVIVLFEVAAVVAGDSEQPVAEALLGVALADVAEDDPLAILVRQVLGGGKLLEDLGNELVEAFRDAGEDGIDAAGDGAAEWVFGDGAGDAGGDEGLGVLLVQGEAFAGLLAEVVLGQFDPEHGDDSRG
jgi:hypothetical protein